MWPLANQRQPVLSGEQPGLHDQCDQLWSLQRQQRGGNRQPAGHCNLRECRPGGGLNNSGVVNWTLGTLTTGQTTNVTLTVTAPASGSLTNVASVSTPTGDPNLTNNLTPPVITTVTPVADVGIGKTGSASVFAASNLVYTISV
jgi:hypothetical protein